MEQMSNELVICEKNANKLREEELGYKRFLEKKEYYEQLVKKISSMSTDDIRKDINLIYELNYGKKYLEKYVSGKQLDIEDEVKYIIEVFDSILMKGVADDYKKKNHSDIIKVKYNASEYKGEYKVKETRVINVYKLLLKIVCPSVLAIIVIDLLTNVPITETIIKAILELLE